jgi:hypothetical protein
MVAIYGREGFPYIVIFNDPSPLPVYIVHLSPFVHKKHLFRFVIFQMCRILDLREGSIKKGYITRGSETRHIRNTDKKTGTRSFSEEDNDKEERKPSLRFCARKFS